MAGYRSIAEGLVDSYDANWEENPRLKEACIYSVETLVANMVNVLILVALAIVTQWWLEIATYFFTFASIRIYAGGAHAKNFRRCITFYSLTMLACIVIAKGMMGTADIYIFLVGIGCVCWSGWVNARYAARYKTEDNEKERCRRAVKRTFILLIPELVILWGVAVWYECLNMKVLFLVQTLAMAVQGIALAIERNE